METIIEFLGALIDPKTRDRSRIATVIWATIAIYFALWAYSLAALPPDGSGNAEFLSELRGGYSFVIGLVLFGFPLRLDSLAQSARGWRTDHHINAIVMPLLAPVWSRLNPGQQDAVRRRSNEFVKLVFLPFVDGKSPQTTDANIRGYWRGKTVLRVLVVNELVTLAWLGALIINFFRDRPSAVPSMFGAFALGFLVIVVNSFFVNSARRRAARFTQLEIEDVQALGSALYQKITQTLNRFNVPVSSELSMPQMGRGSEGVDAKPPIAHGIGSPGEAEYVVARTLLGAEQNVLMFDPVHLPKAWVFHLTPGLIYARERGIEVGLLLPDAAGHEAREAYRFLGAMGCEVRTLSLPSPDGATFSGVLSDAARPTACLVALVRESTSALRGWFVEGAYAQPVVAAVAAGLNVKSVQGRPAAGATSPTSLLLSSMPEAVLIKRLKRVPEYKKCDIKIERVNVNDTRPMSKRVRRSTEIQVSYLEGMYTRAGIDLFRPAKVELANGQFSPVVPPVLEEDRHGFLRVHEGHTRLFSRIRLVRDGKVDAHVYAVVVRGADPPPQKRTPHTWEEVEVANDLDYTDTEFIHTHSLETFVRTVPNGSGRMFDFMSLAELQAAG